MDDERKPNPRKGVEFSRTTKRYAWRSQKGLCAHCGEPLDPHNYHAHHRLGINLWHERFDGLIRKSTIKSHKNCRLLHPECHRKIHSGSFDYEAVVQELLFYQNKQLNLDLG